MGKIASSIVGIFLFAGLSDQSLGDTVETCRYGHVCAEARGYRSAKSGSADRGAVGCGIRYEAVEMGSRRKLAVSLISGEGTILPYTIFEIHFREDGDEGTAPKTSYPIQAWVFSANKIQITDGWHRAVRNQVLVIRKDILPEQREKIVQLTELVAFEPHIIVVEATRGTFTHYFIVPQSRQPRVAAEFLECVEDIRRSVRSIPPSLN